MNSVAVERENGKGLADNQTRVRMFAEDLADAVVEALRGVDDLGTVATGGERQAGPAEMFQVARVRRLLAQVPQRGGDARLVLDSLRREQHERGRRRNRLGHAAEYA